MTDGLSTLYRDLLGGSYDCDDRIVLNAYFRTGHDPGGFRVWWRALTGSDETLENAYLMRLAGRFSRRIRGYATAHDIPVFDCPAGQRKHGLRSLDRDFPLGRAPWALAIAPGPDKAGLLRCETSGELNDAEGCMVSPGLDCYGTMLCASPQTRTQRESRESPFGFFRQVCPL
jgi:hypothetical protein